MYDGSQAWFRAGVDAWLLGAESATVMALRMQRMAVGDQAAFAEAERMVTEKVRAGFELQASLISDVASLTPLAGMQKTLRHYRGKVAANRRRLTRAR